MLDFKNYIEEEIKKESLSGTGRFLGGFGGNLIGQTAKGGWNIAKGTAKTVKGLVKTPVDLVAGGGYSLLGNKEKVLEKVKDIGKDLSGEIFSGLKDVVKGAIQIGGAATLITPVLRGLQASNEKGISQFNKNRNSAQRFFGLNSNKQKPLVINNVPESTDEFKLFVNDVYEETKAGKQVSCRMKPEEFLKKLVYSYKKVSSDKSIDKKVKYLIQIYFPNFEIIEIAPGYFLNKINSEVFYENSSITDYINYLYNKSLKEKIVLITGDDNLFFRELTKIHNEYLSSNNLIKKSKESIAILKNYKYKVVRIIEKFLPNKKLKLSKKTAG